MSWLAHRSLPREKALALSRWSTSSTRHLKPLRPGIRDITHTCASDHSGGRLDRWLLSSDLIQSVHSTDIHSGLPGDHLGVVVRIQADSVLSKGPTPWVFPLELVDDLQYTAELGDLVRRTLQDRPVGPELTHGQRWDDLKRDIRDHATEFTRLSKLRQSAHDRFLRSRASQARTGFIADPTATSSLMLWQQANHALQNHIHDRAQAAAVRAGVFGSIMASSPPTTSTISAGRGSRPLSCQRWQTPGARRPL